ncbi:MAG: hypothetical protein ACRDD4_11080 [Culicoidibacterales bacterium]
MSQSLPKSKQIKLFQILMAIEKKVDKKELINRQTGKPYTKIEVNNYVQRYIEKVIADEV